MRIIVNPEAGRRLAKKKFSELEKILIRENIDVRLTHAYGEATELAGEAVGEGVERLLVMGGDGTVCEVVNGIFESDVELGIIPVGTGNDFARSLGIPMQPEQALKIALSGQVRRVDLGQDNDSVFCSVLGVGFPADVAEAANRLFWVKGSAAFFFGMYRSLVRMRPFPVEIRLDNQKLKCTCTSIMVQNTPYTGGGLFVAPEARVDDGKLDIIVVGDIGKLNLMFNFPRLYWGTHLSHSAFSAYQSSKVVITSERPLRKIFDGDIKGTTPVRLQVLPGALKVVVKADKDGNHY